MVMTEVVLPHRVLFVDHDRSMRVTFTHALHGLGIEVDTAESVGRAIEMASQTAYPVVVAEARMPGIDGFALLERLSGLHRPTAFVLVTAEADLGHGIRGRADGAIASLLRKPWTPDELEATLAHALQLHRRRAARTRPSDAPTGWSVLVVEDNPTDARLVTTYLRDFPKLSLQYATRLSDAVRMLHDQRFDLIITDLVLPDARGFDAVLRLQASAPNAAILVCSNLDDEAMALQVVQLGAQEYLLKRHMDERSLARSLRFARERKRSEQRLRRLAHYDQLTGLANRPSFDESLAVALSRARRRNGHLVVMMLDLDGFKGVNDHYGHDAGDRLLQEVGVRLRCLLREYDAVARLGGDEFAVVLTDVGQVEGVALVAERVVEALAKPITVGVVPVRVSASVGVALYPESGSSPARLLKSADVAMYQAKHAGGNRYRYHDPSSEAAPDGSLPPADSDAWRILPAISELNWTGPSSATAVTRRR